MSTVSKGSQNWNFSKLEKLENVYLCRKQYFLRNRCASANFSLFESAIVSGNSEVILGFATQNLKKGVTATYCTTSVEAGCIFCLQINFENLLVQEILLIEFTRLCLRFAVCVTHFYSEQMWFCHSISLVKLLKLHKRAEKVRGQRYDKKFQNGGVVYWILRQQIRLKLCCGRLSNSRSVDRLSVW